MIDILCYSLEAVIPRFPMIIDSFVTENWTLSSIDLYQGWLNFFVCGSNFKNNFHLERVAHFTKFDIISPNQNFLDLLNLILPFFGASLNKTGHKFCLSDVFLSDKRSAKIILRAAVWLCLIYTVLKMDCISTTN